MPGAPTKIVKAVWHLLPAPIRRKLRTEPGTRFMRFVPVSLAALAASQISLAILVGVAGVSAGVSAFVASITGAAVSYVLSRWAWKRKGRPSLLKETLPFWLVSLGAWTVLGLTSHYASVWALSMGHTHWQRVVIVDGAYLLANAMTFVTRFAIFHYVLFANKTDRGKAAQVLSPGQQLAETEPGDDQNRLELAGDQRGQPRARR